MKNLETLMEIKIILLLLLVGLQPIKTLERILIKLCEEENFDAIFPPINLCGDNAAMIAMVGLEKFKIRKF